MVRYSKGYLEKLLANAHDFSTNGDLLSILAVPSNQDGSKLPEWAEAYVQVVNWQAMSYRSGVFTYYESFGKRPSGKSWLSYLSSIGHGEIATILEEGIDKEDVDSTMDAIDEWIDGHQKEIGQCLSTLVNLNKEFFFELP